MRVPLAAPGRMGPDEAAAVQDAVAQVIRSDRWILGPHVAAFESDFAAYLGHADREVVGIGNGTDALVVALLALELPIESTVLVADDEGGYAASAARQSGLRIRVMDIDDDLGVPTLATAQAAYTPDVAAIVITHLHGDAVPLEEVDSWRKERGLALIEDCAQAHGLRIGGRHVGGTGDAATFSFYPTKNLGALGDAGAVSLRPEQARRARSLRQYGWGERYRIEYAGGRNTRLDELQAAVLRARLRWLDEANARRRAVAARYRRFLSLAGDPETTVAHHAVALFADRSARDEAAISLDRVGVDNAVHYPFLVSEMPGLHVTGPPTPGAARRRGRILTLPCFPGLTEDELEHVESTLARLSVAGLGERLAGSVEEGR